MEKCDCYREGIKVEPRYNQYSGEYVGCVDVKYEYCVGTKDIEECSCGGDRTKCDFYSEVREKAIKEENFLENRNPYFDEDGALVFKSTDGTSIRITNKGLYLKDKYGNEMYIEDSRACLEDNAPSYEELYNYWLETKQK